MLKSPSEKGFQLDTSWDRNGKQQPALKSHILNSCYERLSGQLVKNEESDAGRTYIAADFMGSRSPPHGKVGRSTMAKLHLSCALVSNGDDDNDNDNDNNDDDGDKDNDDDGDNKVQVPPELCNALYKQWKLLFTPRRMHLLKVAPRLLYKSYSH